MSALQPDCYGHCGRKAAIGRMFCSARCAGEYAEELVRGNEDHWCPVCKDWSAPTFYESRLDCGHVRTDIVEGMKHVDAKKKYEEALEGAKRAAPKVPPRCTSPHSDDDPDDNPFNDNDPPPRDFGDL